MGHVLADCGCGEMKTYYLNITITDAGSVARLQNRIDLDAVVSMRVDYDVAWGMLARGVLYELIDDAKNAADDWIMDCCNDVDRLAGIIAAVLEKYND